MPRYIFLTFLFMGWAFYELSGGADFEPPSKARQAALAPAFAEPTQRNRIRSVQRARAQAAATLVAEPAVQRDGAGSAETAPTLVSAQPADTGATTPPFAATAQSRPDPAPKPELKVASLQDLSERPATSMRELVTAKAAASAFATPAVVQSSTADAPAQARPVLAAAGTTPAAAAIEAAPEAPPARQSDLREVVASRVNMRAGPGTRYDILLRLDRGHQVEVLEDPGGGWLRLRVLPEDRVGWIAKRLISLAD